MRIFNENTLSIFWDDHADSKASLKLWYKTMEGDKYKDLQDIQTRAYSSVEFVANDNYVFNIGGNNYRLIVKMYFNSQTILILDFYTHAQYDALTKKQIAALRPYK